MSFPAFHQSDRVGQFFRPDLDAVSREAATAGVRPSSEDTYRTLLLIVDAQVDFVHTDGALSIPGAVDDTRRLIGWLFTHLEHITHVVVSLDSHHTRQIFYPEWWQAPDGNQPEPGTAITAGDVAQGRWIPRVLPDWSRRYVQALERSAKKTLIIWPYHTMIGTPGHVITPALYEATAYHAGARAADTETIIKGLIPQTEYYSIFEPEIKVPDAAGGTLNTALLDRVATYDAIYVTGQAKSHCVLESLLSMAHYSVFQPGLLSRVHLLEDTTSSVVHPEIDFEALARQTLDDLERQGLRRITTGDPLT